MPKDLTVPNQSKEMLMLRSNIIRHQKVVAGLVLGVRGFVPRDHAHGPMR